LAGGQVIGVHAEAYFGDKDGGMKRKSFEGDLCAIARALDLIGDWWTLLIIRDAVAGIGRFSEFQRNLGIPKNMLSGRLKSMKEQGLLEAVPAQMVAYISNMS
jgi:DNA-binding HxlR family transcriptional regulator